MGKKDLGKRAAGEAETCLWMICCRFYDPARAISRTFQNIHEGVYPIIHMDGYRSVTSSSWAFASTRVHYRNIIGNKVDMIVLSPLSRKPHSTTTH